MEIFTFEATYKNGRCAVIAQLEPNFKWFVIDSKNAEDCGWAYILMQRLENREGIALGEHDIIHLKLPDHNIITEQELGDEIHEAIYKYMAGFTGIDDVGNLVRQNEDKSRIHQISKYISTANAPQNVIDDDIYGLIGIAVNSKNNETIIVCFDIFEERINTFTNINALFSHMKKNNFIYAGQIVIDNPEDTLKEEASEYIKMISVELLS